MTEKPDLNDINYEWAAEEVRAAFEDQRSTIGDGVERPFWIRQGDDWYWIDGDQWQHRRFDGSLSPKMDFHWNDPSDGEPDTFYVELDGTIALHPSQWKARV